MQTLLVNQPLVPCNNVSDADHLRWAGLLEAWLSGFSTLQLGLGEWKAPKRLAREVLGRLRGEPVLALRSLSLAR